MPIDTVRRIGNNNQIERILIQIKNNINGPLKSSLKLLSTRALICIYF